MKMPIQTNGSSAWLNGQTFTYIAVIAIAALSIFLFSNGLSPSNYKTVHFALNYDTEFLKRGLVGEVFRLVGVSPWGRAPRIFTLIVLALLTGFYALAVHALLRQRNEPVLALSLVALWASPAFIPHLAADFGRFDALLLMLLGGWAISTVKLPAKLSLTLLLFVACTSILIHEVALFATVPLGFMLWLIRYDEPFISSTTVVFGGVTLLAFALTWAFGNGDILTPQMISNMISDKYGDGNYSIELILLVLFGDIVENVVYSAEAVSKGFVLREHLKFLAVMIGFILFLGWMVFTAVRHLPRYGWLAILACLTPMLIYPFGFDYFRWLSFVLINMTVLSIWIMFHYPKATESIVSLYARRSPAILVLAVLFLVVGPVGIFSSFALMSAPLSKLILP